jgi:hypothetical protein
MLFHPHFDFLVVYPFIARRATTQDNAQLAGIRIDLDSLSAYFSRGFSGTSHI